MDKIEAGDILTLIDENEQEQEMEVLSMITLDGKEYVAVGPPEETQEESEEDIDVIFFKIEGDEQLSTIESDEEFDKVFAAFDEAEEEQKGRS